MTALLKYWQVFVIAILCGMLVGSIVGWNGAAWWYGPNWKKQVELVKNRAIADQKLLKDKHEEDLRIANARVKIKEVIRYVKDNRACDIPEPVERLLDESRGVSKAPGRVDGAGSTVASDALLSQREELEGHMDCGLRYQELVNKHNKVIEWYKAN